MNNPISRKYYNWVHYIVDSKSKQVRLLPEFFNSLSTAGVGGRNGFKKLGGSSIGDVLDMGGFSSPFKAWTNYVRIGLPVLDRKYVDAGIHIEPKVIELLKQKNPDKVIFGIKAEDYGYDYVKTLDNSVTRSNPDIKKYIGGVPDGFNQTDNAVIEIKTSGEKNIEKWQANGLPANYLRQAQYYAYLMEASRYAIVATFLKEEDYVDTHNYPINDRKKKVYTYTTNVAQASDDVRKSIEWYKKYVETGISPEFDPVSDSDVIEWLECRNEEEWLKLKDKWKAIGKYKE